MGEVIKASARAALMFLVLPLSVQAETGTSPSCYESVVGEVRPLTLPSPPAIPPEISTSRSLAIILDRIFPHLSLTERVDLSREIQKRVEGQIARSRELGFFERSDRFEKWESDTVEVIAYPDQVLAANGIGNFWTLNLAYNRLQRDLSRLAGKVFNIAAHVLPFFPSPLADGGYDVANYFSVRRSLGGLRAYDSFANSDKCCGMVGRRMVIDLIANHVSDQSPEFKRALQGEAEALNLFVHTFSKPIDEGTFYENGVPFKSYLVQGKYGVWVRRRARLTFAGLVNTHWTREVLPDGREVYFFSQFLHQQKDLNWENPAVLIRIMEIANFWVNRGASTLRLDAIPFLDKQKENSPRTLAIVEFLQTYFDAVAPHVVLRNEAAVPARELARLTGNSITGPHPITGEPRTRTERARSNYYFPMIPNAFASFFSGNKKFIEEAITDLAEIKDASTLNFPTRTHDEVTFETASPEVAEINRRHLLFGTYEGRPRGARFRGDRDDTAAGISGSTAAFFDFNSQRILSYFAFYLSLPGQISFQLRDIFAMGNDWQLAERKHLETGGYDSRFINRGAIPAASLNGGMSPVQREVYEGTVRLIAARMNLGDVMRRGDIHLLPNSNANVTSFVRSYENKRVIVLKNVSDKPTAISLSKSQVDMTRARDALTGRDYDFNNNGSLNFQLAADQTIWLIQR